MDTRRLSWIMLAFGAGLMVMMLLARSNQDPPAEPTSKPTSKPASRPTTTSAPATSRPTSRPASRPATAITRPKPSSGPKYRTHQGTVNQTDLRLGSLDPDSGFMFEVQFNSNGAAIHTVKLSQHYATVADKRRAADIGWAKYREELAAGAEGLFGPYSVLNPASYKDIDYYAMATRQVKVTLPDGTTARYRHDPQLRSASYRARNSAWRSWQVLDQAEAARLGLASTDDVQRVSFWWAFDYAPTREADLKPAVRLIKTYEVRKNDYTIYVSIRVENLTGAEVLKVDLNQAGPAGVPRENARDDLRKVAYGKFNAEDKKIEVSAEKRKKLEEAQIGSPTDVGGSFTEGVTWIGQTNKFFGAMLHMVSDDEASLVARKPDATYYYQDILETSTSASQITGLNIPLKVPAGADNARTVNFELFVGPKDMEMFGDNPRYESLRYQDTLDLRSCFCASDWLGLRAVEFLSLLASYVTFGNYGVAIFVLVILVRLLLHPLTKKGQVMMSKMKKLGPMMKELEKKYADDKEALNRERIKLYKEQGASPFLGCLPMLLQMPILIALWTGVSASVGLRHAAFLPVWIVDLAAPDRLFPLGFELPYLGNTFNLIPLLLGAAMFWQMKFNPQAATATSPEQESQQKMMKVMMPLMMMVMFYPMASGLTLYFLASTFFGAVEQSYIRRHLEAAEALEAATTTTVQMPGRGPRGSRPKKPKGPKWFKKG